MVELSFKSLSPSNSYLNIILSLDNKGVSNIYKLMNGQLKEILDKAVKNWTDKVEIDINVFSIGGSSSKLSKIDDIYIRYIQFKTLRRHFYTNNILFKIGIQDYSFCNLCLEKENLNEHMLIEYQI